MKKQIKKINQIAVDLFAKMGLDIEAETKTTEDIFCLNIKPKDESSAPLLIGYHGENLAALQHMIRMLVNKVFEAPTRIMVDIDGYKERQKEALAEMVQRIAEKVKRTGRLEILRPMNGYERRIVHLALSEIPGVVTESIGEDPDRRVMIKSENSEQ